MSPCLFVYATHRVYCVVVPRNTIDERDSKLAPRRECMKQNDSVQRRDKLVPVAAGTADSTPCSCPVGLSKHNTVPAVSLSHVRPETQVSKLCFRNPRALFSTGEMYLMCALNVVESRQSRKGAITTIKRFCRTNQRQCGRQTGGRVSVRPVPRATTVSAGLMKNPKIYSGQRLLQQGKYGKPNVGLQLRTTRRHERGIFDLRVA